MLELYAQPLCEIPIRFPDASEIRRSEELVDEILRAISQGKPVTPWEELLEQLVHTAYGLTQEQSQQVLAFYRQQAPSSTEEEKQGGEERNELLGESEDFH